MAQPQRLRHVLAQCGNAIALGGVVASRDESGPHFAGQMGLGFGNFARDKSLRPGSQGGFKKALCPARTPGQASNRLLGRTANPGGTAAQRVFNLIDQGLGAGKGTRANQAQLLLAKTAIGHHPQALAQLRVVAQGGVGIQRQVVGDQVDIVRQQKAQALFEPARHAPIHAAPKQAVVNEDGIGPVGNGRFNQGPAGRHTGHDVAHLRLALHLQAIGAVVFKTLRLQQASAVLQQVVTGNLHGAIVPKWQAGASAIAHNAAFCPRTTMKRYWLLFAQTVTVLLALYFVIATLQPAWLQRGQAFGDTGLVLLQAPSTPHTEPVAGSLSHAAQAAMPAVVSITTSQAVRHPRANDPWFQFFFGDIGTQQKTGLGSGVIVSSDGYILTNNHVVEGADEIEISLTDGRRTSATIIGTDPESDLAVLKIALEQLPVVTLGNSDHIAVGDQVLAIGNPFGVGQTVTSGIISALGRSHLGINTFENFIQTDAAINPGNSGGALVDINGHLLGINTAIYSRSGGSMGIGFAIPVSTAKVVLDGIVREGQVTRGWIGVEPGELSPELAQTFGVAPGSGVIIAGVLQAGPAAQAGMQPGDVVRSVHGQPTRTVAELLSTVAALRPGQSYRVEVLRNGQTQTLEVTPVRRPAPAKNNSLPR